MKFSRRISEGGISTRAQACPWNFDDTSYERPACPHGMLSTPGHQKVLTTRKADEHDEERW
jgi:hypothetical protein